MTQINAFLREQTAPNNQPITGERIRVAVPAGQTSQWFVINASGKVAVSPGASGTMNVQLTSSPPSIVQSDNEKGTSLAIAEAWTAGASATQASNTFQYATAIRFIAATTAGLGEIAT